MAQRQFGAVLLLSVIVPLLVSTIILIIVVMVVPNSEPQTGSVSQNGQSTGNKTQQQVSPSYETKSRVLFILGIVFASSLFVLLIVVIAVVCTWARQAKGYVVGDQDCELTNQVYSDADCQLTKHTENVYESNQTKNAINTRKDRLESITLAALPSPPVRTVAVTTQVTPKNSGKRGVDDNCQNFNIHGLETRPVVQPKGYGTLGRTHLLSTADEDGYHIDNLGFDSEEAGAEEFLSRQSSATVYEHSFPDVISEFVGTIQSSAAEGQSPQVTSAAELDSSDQDNSSKKQLSKQDSFQGLPPLRSFDRYLTLVRLDSDTSLEAYSLEETRKIWKSIDEEDEKEEVKNNLRKKKTDNK